MDVLLILYVSVFFFNDTATTEIYTPSLHDALPIWSHVGDQSVVAERGPALGQQKPGVAGAFDLRHDV